MHPKKKQEKWVILNRLYATSIARARLLQLGKRKAHFHVDALPTTIPRLTVHIIDPVICFGPSGNIATGQRANGGTFSAAFRDAMDQTDKGCGGDFPLRT